MIKYFPSGPLFLIFCFLLIAQAPSYAQQDAFHFSNTFNAKKPYRIYLPSNYQQTSRRYPVIYFFHGNKGDHKLQFASLQKLVDSCSVIVAAWNGRSKYSDERPYNIGYHSNVNYQIQFKDYFPEFVRFIDATYRTKKNRSSRALMGHSMGGFMSFFLAGKYPDLVNAAVSSKGSPEFFVGYPSNHSLYSVRHMFQNLNGLKIRFHNGTPGEEMFYLNSEVNEGAMKNSDLDYSYQEYEGGHDMSDGEFGNAFRFLAASFNDPVAQPKRWHHADLYPGFKVWGYEINSNLTKSAFIDLKGVTKDGFRIATKKWEPDGVPVQGALVEIKTAPVYIPEHSYRVFDFNETTGKQKISAVKSDKSGRISIKADHQPHQLGIHEANGLPEIVYLTHRVNGAGIFLDHHKPCQLTLQLLNRGGRTAKNITVRLSSRQPGIEITKPEINIGDINGETTQWAPVDFSITAGNKPTTDGSPFKVRFDLHFTDSEGNEWKDEFDAPVFYDVPPFTQIGIDDGDSEIFGSGNGDNIADPGETIMIYQQSNRTRLYYDDPYIDNERLHDDLQPDKWGDGYALSSLVHISKNCPVGHTIRFLACYEIKEWNAIKRNVTWGWFTITIGKP